MPVPVPIELIIVSIEDMIIQFEDISSIHRSFLVLAFRQHLISINDSISALLALFRSGIRSLTLEFLSEIFMFRLRRIPAPVAPPMVAISDVIGDAVAIAIVCFVVNISMAKLFATKYKYQISPNQELFAYSTGNIILGFFHGFPACVALSRCAVVETTGGKTQVREG